MCVVADNVDYTNPAIGFVSQQAGEQGLSNMGVGGTAGQALKTHTFNEKAGGFIPNITYDPNDPGQAPDGFYSSYRFGPNGQIEGSIDGKEFAAIDGLSLDTEALGSAFKPAPAKDVGRPTSLAEAIYNTTNPRSEPSAKGMQAQFAKGGEIRDFKVDKDGNLFARVKSKGEKFMRTPAGLQRMDTLLTGVGGQEANYYEGYIPITGFPLENSGDGNIKAGRSAFFNPDGTVAFNERAGEDYGGMLVAYSRKAQQALKQADNANLRTGQRAGG